MGPPGGEDQQDLGWTLFVRPAASQAEVEAAVRCTSIHRDAQRPATAAPTASPVHDKTSISASARVPVAGLSALSIRAPHRHADTAQTAAVRSHERAPDLTRVDTT